jgi:transposase
VTNALGHDPLSGHLFLFSNRARNRLKVLVWESSGFWLFAKRLERGTFAWPDAESQSVELSHAQLALLLGGIDLRATKARKWYRRAPSAGRMESSTTSHAQGA